jgi:hypothetical protein
MTAVAVDAVTCPVPQRDKRLEGRAHAARGQGRIGDGQQRHRADPDELFFVGRNPA